MIDQITKNEQDVELYYQMGSAHGNIRLMLHKYIYDETTLNEIINEYSERYGKVTDIQINMHERIISFTIYKNSLTFHNEFADAFYKILKNYLYKLESCIKTFEDEDKRNYLLNSLQNLHNPEYYFTLFRCTFISHENQKTTCMLHL